MNKEEIEFPNKQSFGSLERKRNAIKIENSRLKRMVQTNGWCSGAIYIDKNGRYTSDESKAVRIQRYWRGQRSKRIKTQCNRKFRRSDKFKLLTSRMKGIYHRCTEFWWEYD